MAAPARALARRLHPQRVRRTLRSASFVRKPVRFLANELSDSRSLRQYGRLADLEAAAVVLEYHPAYGPDADPEAMVERALAGAGYETRVAERGDDAGLVWAWKADGGARC
jgi:hypothetical protein